MPAPQRRLQIFVSSTYLDLKEERQAAVEAILKAKHIPAGMELFAAGSSSQLDVIKRWIDESDVYLLILGHRYGSIEPDSKKSYTQVEYEYAIAKGKPFFAVVASDDWRKAKQSTAKDPNDVVELENPALLKAFRELVKSKVCRFFDDRKDIQLAIHESLHDLQRDHDFVGWVRGDAVDQQHELERQIAGLKGELTAAHRRTAELEKQVMKASAAPKGGALHDWAFITAQLQAVKVDLNQGLTKEEAAKITESTRQNPHRAEA